MFSDLMPHLLKGKQLAFTRGNVRSGYSPQRFQSECNTHNERIGLLAERQDALGEEG
jgi:hypothetical protein